MTDVNDDARRILAVTRLALATIGTFKDLKIQPRFAAFGLAVYASIAWMRHLLKGRSPVGRLRHSFVNTSGRPQFPLTNWYTFLGAAGVCL